MARSRDQRSVKNDSAATRANAHKLGKQVSTWSTVRHHSRRRLTLVFPECGGFSLCTASLAWMPDALTSESAAYCSNHGRLVLNFHPGMRYRMATLSLRAPRPWCRLSRWTLSMMPVSSTTLSQGCVGCGLHMAARDLERVAHQCWPCCQIQCVLMALTWPGTAAIACDTSKWLLECDPRVEVSGLAELRYTHRAGQGPEVRIGHGDVYRLHREAVDISRHSEATPWVAVGRLVARQNSTMASRTEKRLRRHMGLRRRP